MNTTAMRWYLTKIRPMRFLAAATAAFLLALSFGAQAQFPQQHPNIVQKAQTGVRPEMTPIPACGCPPTVNFNVKMLNEPQSTTALMLGMATGRFVARTANGCEYAYVNRSAYNPAIPLGEIIVRQDSPQACAETRTFTYNMDMRTCTVPPTSFSASQSVTGANPYQCTAAPTCGLVAAQYVEIANVARVSLQNGFCHYRPTAGQVVNNPNLRASVQFNKQ